MVEDKATAELHSNVNRTRQVETKAKNSLPQKSDHFPNPHAFNLHTPHTQVSLNHLQPTLPLPSTPPKVQNVLRLDAILPAHLLPLLRLRLDPRLMRGPPLVLVLP